MKRDREEERGEGGGDVRERKEREEGQTVPCTAKQAYLTVAK